MSNEFPNYVPIQDIAQGGDSGVITITETFSESASFPDGTELTETITESATVQVT